MSLARRPSGLPNLGTVSRIVAVSATRRTDAGRERVALNTAYVYALMRAGLVPLLVPPILDPEAACAALGEVTRKYPRASGGVKAAVDREQKRVKC